MNGVETNFWVTNSSLCKLFPLEWVKIQYLKVYYESWTVVRAKITLNANKIKCLKLKYFSVLNINIESLYKLL